jgi:hypothetical protein
MSQDPRSSVSFPGSLLILLVLACTAAPTVSQPTVSEPAVSQPAVVQDSQEPAPSSGGTATSGQEPAPEQEFKLDTKLPERPQIKWVFAHEVGESAEKLSYEERQRRALIYTAGGGYLNLVTLETLLDAEAARRAAAGERVGGDAVTDERVASLVQEQVDLFKAQAPNGDFFRMRLVEGYAPDHYFRTVKLVLRVVDMFFPSDPDLWPMKQLEDVFMKGQPTSSYDAIEQQWNADKELKAQGQALPEMPDDFLLSYMMLPSVFAWLRRDATIETPFNGLPEGVALRINGRGFKTEELIDQIRALISDVGEEAASNLVGLLEAIETDLRAQKKWLSRATLDALWQAERAGYEGTIFTHDQTVIDFLGYPSLEIYRQYFNARMSYRTLLPDPIPQEMVDAEVAARGAFLGLGKVDTDVILIGAVDKGALEYMTSPRLYKPGANPFAEAGERALEVAQQLKDGESFDSLLLEYSDFPPRAPGGNSALQRDRGRFGSLTRADLRSLLGESDYTDFLSGYSIGDDLFFKAEPNAVYGPTLGPLGWYIYRMTRREAPTSPLDPVNDPRQAYQLEEDLITQGFLAYVNGLR